MKKFKKFKVWSEEWLPGITVWFRTGSSTPFTSKAAATKSARLAEKRSKAWYKRNPSYIRLSYDDIYHGRGMKNVKIVESSDIPTITPLSEDGYTEDQLKKKEAGSEEGRGFKSAYEDIWADTSATRTLQELVEMAKTDNDVKKFVERLAKVYPDKVVRDTLKELIDKLEESTEEESIK